MSPNIWKLALAVSVAGGVLLFQDCSNVGFQSTSKASGTDGTSGTPAVPPVVPPGGNDPTNACNNATLAITTLPIKILIVVDTSGSNAGDATHPGTDSGKVHRAASIQQFFTDFGGKSNFNWGFISFAGSSATALLNSGNSAAATFTNSAANMQSAITYFETSIPDYGMTPYQAAMQMASQAIANDTAAATTKYIVVFLSDGMPTDYPDSSAGDAQIASDVTNLVNLKAGQITFNTVYYGFLDASASGRLSMMAASGHGQFLDTNANPNAKDFLINSVVTVPGAACR